MIKMRELSKKWKAAKHLLSGAENIYIFAHSNLDGDALGSLGAMVLALRKAGFANSFAVIGEKVTKSHEFLLPPSEMTIFVDETTDFGGSKDVALLVDCANMGRLNENSLRIAKKCGPKIKIDHHLRCEGSDFADVDLSCEQWSATCEGLFHIIKNFVCEVDYEIGIRLYSGIMTDSGRLTYSCTTGETLRTTAEIVDIIGTCNTWVTERYFEKKPETTFRLHAIAFEKMKVLADGKLVVCRMTTEDFKRAGAEISECSAIAAELLMVDGAVMSLFMRPFDMDENNNALRISMRSSEPYDVGTICGKFGGGGHKCASGATLSGDAEERLGEVIAEALKAFE